MGLLLRVVESWKAPPAPSIGGNGIIDIAFVESNAALAPGTDESYTPVLVGLAEDSMTGSDCLGETGV